MTPEDVKRFETLQDMFAHPGWQLLVDEFDLTITALKEEVLAYKMDYDRVMYTRGRITTLRDIRAFPAVIEQALKDEEEDEQADSV